MGSNFPVRNESMNETISEMNHIMNCGYVINLFYDPRSYKRNVSNCVEKPENFR